MAAVIRCILLDDDLVALENLQTYTQQIAQLEIVGAFSKVMEAYQCLLEHKIDVLISDINMPMIDGLAFVRSLKNPPLVIFQTSHQQYAIDSYEVEAVDFLTKPYSFERFFAAIQKVIKRVNERQNTHLLQAADFTFVKSDGDYVRLLFENIRYVESYQNYVKVFTLKDMIIVRMSMRKIEEQFPSYFVRIHRSIIVNTHQIAVVKQEEVVLKDGTNLMLGKHFYEEVKEKVVNHYLLK